MPQNATFYVDIQYFICLCVKTKKRIALHMKIIFYRTMLTHFKITYVKKMN